VFVLTHYPRESIPMQGGTTFHFVTDGIHRALERATAAANGKDVGIGGIATVQQYLRAALVDELHLSISPVLLGSGERFLGDIDLVKLGYTCTEYVAGERALNPSCRQARVTRLAIDRTVAILNSSPTGEVARSNQAENGHA